MNLSSSAIPERILRLISSAERVKLGASGMTASEAQHRYARQQERKMHEEFEQWLNLHRDELYWDHSRMDKRTTNRKGHPDFVIQRGGRVVNIEFKAPGGVLSEDQKEVHAWMSAVNAPTHVCFDVASAIKITKEKLSL